MPVEQVAHNVLDALAADLPAEQERHVAEAAVFKPWYKPVAHFVQAVT